MYTYIDIDKDIGVIALFPHIETFREQEICFYSVSPKF